ncbi:fimbrial protein [Pseudomonas citronellolis]|uniref:fimbrial protein n=1 Tax=Pseudomonas citronellolis TaxID=53408 RepID=UPI0023E39474|nr:fimbrial protein [Pseudomonas citronellolis]MDF3931442.1 fimbrial protein [Pseudomonas citronellolis]
MNKTLAAALACAAGLGLCASAQAADGTLTFEGVINARTCTLDPATSNQTISLSGVNTTDFTGVGTYAGSQPFTLKVSGCDTDAVVAALFATGGSVDPTNGNLNNAIADGTDAQIALFRADTDAKIDLASYGSSAEYTATTDANGDASLAFIARYAAKTATVKPGQLRTQLQYTMSYQ